MDEVKSAIKEVLPNLHEDEVSKLAKHLMTAVGIEGPGDLMFVEEEDLTMLKPIQIRKLLHGWKKNAEHSPEVVRSNSRDDSSVLSSSSDDTIILSPSASTSSEYSSDVESPAAKHSLLLGDWSRNYLIPWDKMSQTSVNCLKKGERPKPSQRREMVRIVVEDVQKITKKPSKKQLSHVAQKMVNQYPAAFKDVIGGQTVGTGFDSLLKNLVQRVYNQNRGDSQKREMVSYEGDTSTSAKKGKRIDQYGCINFSPELPIDETEQSLIIKKEQMKSSFQRGECHDSSAIKHNIKLTYFLQRKDIMSKTLVINDLVVEWPFLFREEGLFTHFEELVGLDLPKSLMKAFETKGKKILKFMLHCGKQHLQSTIHSLMKSKAELGNNSPEIPGVVLLLMKYFAEDSNSLFTVVESTATEDDASGLVPSTPSLVVCGDILTTKRFMLAIDGIVVNANVKNFLSAFAMVMASYYCFGIHYSEKAEATLDFVQRCFLMINPDKGSKMKKASSAHPKVLSLIKGLSDFEWTS